MFVHHSYGNQTKSVVLNLWRKNHILYGPAEKIDFLLFIKCVVKNSQYWGNIFRLYQNQIFHKFGSKISREATTLRWQAFSKMLISQAKFFFTHRVTHTSIHTDAFIHIIYYIYITEFHALLYYYFIYSLFYSLLFTHTTKQSLT